MNYEEMLEARNESKDQRSWLPIGDYRRQQVDGKWCGVITPRPEQLSNIVFEKALASELEANRTLDSRYQLHLEPMDGGQLRLMETGKLVTLEQLLLDDPAVVARKNFLGDMLEALADICTMLHKRGIYHVCFSPKTILMRKGDFRPLLCSHGSFYSGLGNQREFYADALDFVAPEVLNGGAVDERCDVYGIGKLLTALIDPSDMPLEFRRAVKKSVSEAPEDRYATPADMLAAVKKFRSSMRSVLTFIAALVIALVVVSVYFDLMPESAPVEFVKPVPRQPVDDLLDDGITPEELGLGPQDSARIDSLPTESDYEAKAEEIFRKNYEKAADRVLSKIYNKAYMSKSEKSFQAQSKTTINELARIQKEMANEAGLSDERAQLAATQIIDRLTDEKRKALDAKPKYGFQKQAAED